MKHIAVLVLSAASVLGAIGAVPASASVNGIKPRTIAQTWKIGAPAIQTSWKHIAQGIKPRVVAGIRL